MIGKRNKRKQHDTEPQHTFACRVVKVVERLDNGDTITRLVLYPVMHDQLVSITDSKDFDSFVLITTDTDLNKL